MLLLTSASDIIRVVTNSAANADVHASWVDNVSGTITPGRTNTAISSAATTTVVAAPGSGQRNVQTLSIRNRHASLADTITVQHFDGTTSIDLYTTTLSPTEALEFLDGVGFLCFDAQGRVKQAFDAAGRWLKTTVYTTGSGNHTTHPDARVIFVRLWAGGGGGGATTTAATNSAAGGGGSAGGYAEKIFNILGNTAYAYVVGGGGASGGNGNNSTFAVAGVTVTANAGLAGANQTVAAPPLVSLGGAPPAVSTNGDLNGSGDPGEGGNCEAAAVAISGRGGSSMVGAGGLARTTQGNGNNAVGFASGGGGGLTLSGGASTTGGTGSSGLIIIDEMS